MTTEAQINATLQPCKVCGGVGKWKYEAYWWAVRCQSCDRHYVGGSEYVVKAWNEPHYVLDTCDKCDGTGVVPIEWKPGMDPSIMGRVSRFQ